MAPARGSVDRHAAQLRGPDPRDAPRRTRFAQAGGTGAREHGEATCAESLRGVCLGAAHARGAFAVGTRPGVGAVPGSGPR